MRRRTVGNPLALAVLALLAERPMHPYEMSRTMRERKKEESIKLNYGALYTVIDRLANAGFIEVRERHREGQRPERTVYALSGAGREELHDWMRELLSTPQKEYPQFEAALALLAVLPPDEVVPLLRQRVQRLGEESTRLSAETDAEVAAGLDRFFVVETEYRVAMIRAERDWVEALIDLIERGGPDFGRYWQEFHAKGEQ